MAASIITHSNVGGPLAAGAATGGVPGVAWGIYSATSTENSDWIVLPEFSEILFVISKTVAAGAWTDEACTIDATTTNKIVFTAGGTDVIKVMVFGKASIIA